MKPETGARRSILDNGTLFRGLKTYVGRLRLEDGWQSAKRPCEADSDEIFRWERTRSPVFAKLPPALLLRKARYAEAEALLR